MGVPTSQGRVWAAVNEYVLCERLHRVTSYVDLDCACGGHRLWRCKMRVGSRSCGWEWLYPGRSRQCEDEDDE